jgi:hypothetical protein
MAEYLELIIMSKTNIRFTQTWQALSNEIRYNCIYVKGKHTHTYVGDKMYLIRQIL